MYKQAEKDIHICGTCKVQFNDVQLFILHKRENCLGVTQDKFAKDQETNSKNESAMPDMAAAVTPVSVAKNNYTSGKQSVHGKVLHPQSASGQLLTALEIMSVDNNDLNKGTAKENFHATVPEMLSSGSLVLLPEASQSGIKGIKPKETATVAPREKVFRCPEQGCNFITAFNKDLVRHHRTHTGEKPFSCGLCGRKFSRSDKLKIHMRYHDGSKPYTCNECSYSCVDNGSLKKHMRIHTGERPFKCQMCSYTCRNSGQLTVHLRTHTGDCPFMCTHCPSKFKIKSDLKRHLRSHTKEKPFKCPHCNYSCAVKGNLNSHIKLNHSAAELHNCKDCEFQTPSRKVLRHHVRNTHTKSYELWCTDCEHGCSTPHQLKLHSRVHSQEKPYKCIECGYATKHPGNLRAHKKKRHENVDKPEVEAAEKPKKSLPAMVAKEYVCSICNSDFVREDSLRSHMRFHRELQLQAEQSSTNAALTVLQMTQSVSSKTTAKGNCSSGGTNLLNNIDHRHRSRQTSHQQAMANAAAFAENHQNLAVEHNRQNLEAERQPVRHSAFAPPTSISHIQVSNCNYVPQPPITINEGGQHFSDSNDVRILFKDGSEAFSGRPITRLITGDINQVIPTLVTQPGTLRTVDSQTFILHTADSNPVTLEVPSYPGMSNHGMVQVISESTNVILPKIVVSNQPEQVVYQFGPPQGENVLHAIPFHASFHGDGVLASSVQLENGALHIADSDLQSGTSQNVNSQANEVISSVVKGQTGNSLAGSS